MKAIFFDLDNTMYDVRQYFFPAFKEVSAFLSQRYGVSKRTAYRCLVNVWKDKTSAYPFLFNDLMKILDIKDKKAVIAAVKIFNRHSCLLKPYPGLISSLARLRKNGYQLGIITDGNPTRQKRKILSLGIKDYFKVIIYTKKIAAKPSTLPFLVAAEKIKVRPQDAWYVGDNPAVDFKGARESGMTTVRMRRGEFKNLKDGDFVDLRVDNFRNLISLAGKI